MGNPRGKPRKIHKGKGNGNTKPKTKKKNQKEKGNAKRNCPTPNQKGKAGEKAPGLITLKTLLRLNVKNATRHTV
jgi:hypothetical protein